MTFAQQRCSEICIYSSRIDCNAFCLRSTLDHNLHTNEESTTEKSELLVSSIDFLTSSQTEESAHINETRFEKTIKWFFTCSITSTWFAEFKEKIRSFKLSINEQLIKVEYRRIDERLFNLLYARTSLLTELISSIWEQLWCENEFDDRSILERLVWAAIEHVTKIENCEIVKAVKHRRDFKHKSLKRIMTKNRNNIEVKSVLDRNRILFSTFEFAINSRKSQDQDLQSVFKKSAISVHRTRLLSIAKEISRLEKSHSATIKDKHSIQHYFYEWNDRFHLQSSSKKRIYDEILDFSLRKASFVITSSSIFIEAVSHFSSV